MLPKLRPKHPLLLLELPHDLDHDILRGELVRSRRLGDRPVPVLILDTSERCHEQVAALREDASELAYAGVD